MRIDHTHRPWLAVTIAIFAVSTPIFAFYSSRASLAFGIVGYAMMLFAGLLGARKKVPVWRIGRAQTWMRGHLWLGLLSLPMILFHAGFAARGPLTAVLMALMFIVILSGITGAVIQHYVPGLLTAQVPLETIYEEIPHIRQQLREEAAVAEMDDLESIREEERQLARQQRLYHFLHAWLLIHVPLSIALLVLGGVHAIVALRY